MFAPTIVLDIDAARLHVETLFGSPKAIVNIRTTPESEACVARVFGKSKSQVNKQRHRFKFKGRLDDLSSVLHSRNSKGWAVFITPNDTDGRGVKKENITRVRNVVLDLDGASLPARGFRVQPHMIVETSRGKYQCTGSLSPPLISPQPKTSRAGSPCSTMATQRFATPRTSSASPASCIRSRAANPLSRVSFTSASNRPSSCPGSTSFHWFLNSRVGHLAAEAASSMKGRRPFCSNTFPSKRSTATKHG